MMPVRLIEIDYSGDSICATVAGHRSARYFSLLNKMEINLDTSFVVSGVAISSAHSYPGFVTPAPVSLHWTSSLPNGTATRATPSPRMKRWLLLCGQDVSSLGTV